LTSGRSGSKLAVGDRKEARSMAAYDVIVIGGGLVGLSTAWHLVSEGASVLLADDAQAGRATDAGAGILSAATDTDHPDPLQRLTANAAGYYPRIIECLSEEGAGGTGYAVCGSITVAMEEHEIPALERARADLEVGGARCEEITPKEARERFPPLGPIHGAVWTAGRARVDGRLLASSLRQAAIARGLQVVHAEASGFRLRGDRVRGVLVGTEQIPTGQVVIAAGAWSAAFGPAFGIPIPVAPQRGQIAHLDLKGADTRDWPIVNSFGSRHYIVAWEDSRVVAGATRESGSGFAPEITVAGIMAVLAEATRVAPGLREAGLREMRVGLRPASADGLPVLGPLPGVANVLLATGHGPSGLQLGPYSGRLIAQCITEGAPAIDISAFGLERFRQPKG
jgi:D-amino-acid dehydrogenase